MDCGEEVGCQAVVAGCDPPEVFEATEHAFDGISVAAEIGREAVLPDAICLGRDVRHRALGFGQTSDLITVIAFVGVQDTGFFLTLCGAVATCVLAAVPGLPCRTLRA